MKTSELTGSALDWAVAKCEGLRVYQIWPEQINITINKSWEKYEPSVSWSQGGPIVDREFITLRTNACVAGHWAAFIDFGGSNTNVKARRSGPTPLIAAMRCYVASKLGDEVELPEELK